MKKFLCVFLAALILISALFAFASCENPDSDDTSNKEEKKDDAELIVGTWEAEVDMSKLLNDQFALEEEMSDYVKVKDFKFTLRATINEDGTYKIIATEQSVNKAMDNFKKAMVSGIEDYFTDVAEELDMTLEDFLVAMEIASVEEFVDLSFGEEFGSEFVEEFVSEGVYKIKDGKFYTSGDGEDEIDESEYEVYELSANEFKLIEYVGGDDEDSEFAQYIYPMIFKRVK